MKQGLRIKARMRRLTRRYPRIAFTIRSFTIFSAAFGGAYGFISGSRHSGYDPNAFAIGASFLFAIACVALATLSMRMRFMRRRLRKVLLHNEGLVDRNWELKEAEERTRNLFESQGTKYPQPRIRMLDGFNDGWIEFESSGADIVKGKTKLETVLRGLVARAA